jgi:hypothetical protein
MLLFLITPVIEAVESAMDVAASAFSLSMTTVASLAVRLPVSLLYHAMC